MPALSYADGGCDHHHANPAYFGCVEGTPVVPKYVAFGDSITTGFSIPACDEAGEDRKASPWGCNSGAPPAVPYPDRVAAARGYTYSDDPGYYNNPLFFPAPGYPGVTLDRVGIWGYRLDEALAADKDNRNLVGPWKPQFRAIELAQELVTGALGVNNLRWSEDMMEWVERYEKDYNLGGTRVRDEARRRLEAVRPAFVRMFDAMAKAKAGGASVVVFLYYNPYYNGFDCAHAHDISQTLVNVLDDEFLQYYAAQNGLLVADMRPVWAGHGAGVGDNKEYTFGTDCSTTRIIAEEKIPKWFPGAGGGGEKAIKRHYDPHPNDRGTTAIADTILGCLSSPSGCAARWP